MKKNTNTIHQPHDKALHMALHNHKVARDFMYAYLPKELLALAPDLKILRQYETKFITSQFLEFQADIIYEVALCEKQKALFMLHCENQSTVDKYIALRIWQYLLLVSLEHTKKHPDEPLPVIYPIIIYTGDTSYNKSTDLFDLYEKNKELAKKFMTSPIQLVDVCRMPDEDIKKHNLFGLAEFVFKHKASKHFQQTLQKLLAWNKVCSKACSKAYIICRLKLLKKC